MSKRNDDRWGTDSNIGKGKDKYFGWGSWQPRKRGRLDLQEPSPTKGYIRCFKKRVQALKVTPDLVKQIKVFNSLGVKKFAVTKQSDVPATMLKGHENMGFAHELSYDLCIKAEYKGRGKWEISIVG